MRQGAAEFLFPPIQHGTVPARDGLTKRAQAAMAQARSGEIYCLIRGKSGCGTTTLACDLAFRLRALNFRRSSWLSGFSRGNHCVFSEAEFQLQFCPHTRQCEPAG